MESAFFTLLPFVNLYNFPGALVCEDRLALYICFSFWIEILNQSCLILCKSPVSEDHIQVYLTIR